MSSIIIIIRIIICVVMMRGEWFFSILVVESSNMEGVGVRSSARFASLVQGLQGRLVFMSVLMSIGVGVGVAVWRRTMGGRQS